MIIPTECTKKNKIEITYTKNIMNTIETFGLQLTSLNRPDKGEQRDCTKAQWPKSSKVKWTRKKTYFTHQRFKLE